MFPPTYSFHIYWMCFFQTERFNFITNAEADGHIYQILTANLTNELSGVLQCWDSNSVLCISFHAQLQMPHDCLCDLEIRESPLRTMHRHSNPPFLVCIYWYIVVLVFMPVCAFPVFSPRGRQRLERFYQGY